MDINQFMRKLETGFETLQEVDIDSIEEDEVRHFLQELQEFGEDHGFDGKTEEYCVKFYAEFNVYEEAQSPVEAQRRAKEKRDDYLSRRVSDKGFSTITENVECIDVEKE